MKLKINTKKDKINLENKCYSFRMYLTLSQAETWLEALVGPPKPQVSSQHFIITTYTEEC